MNDARGDLPSSSGAGLTATASKALRIAAHVVGQLGRVLPWSHGTTFPQDPDARRLRHRVALAASWLILAAISVNVLELAVEALSTGRFATWDLATFLEAGRKVATGAPLYDDYSSDERILGPQGRFLYSPLIAVAFIPLSKLPEPIAAGIWAGFLFAILGLLAWQLSRALPPTARPLGVAAVIGFLPAFWDISAGNVNLVVLLLVVLAVRCERWTAAFAALIAASLLLKPVAITILLFLAAARRYRLAMSTVLALAVVVVASWPWLGSAWQDYAGLLGVVSQAPPSTYFNVVPSAFELSPARFALPLLALTVSALAGRLAARQPTAAGSLFFLALAAGPLLSSTIWYPYLVFALPLLLTPLALGRQERWPSVILRAIAWILVQAHLLPEASRLFTFPVLALTVVLACYAVVSVLEVRGTRYSARPIDPQGSAEESRGWPARATRTSGS
jgi:hypothetical protein